MHHSPADAHPTPTLVESPEHWIELFTRAFVAGTFAGVARMAELTHPDYRGVQPQLPDALGPDGLLDFFARVYALVPDLRGEVLRAHAHDGKAFIEVRLTGTLGGRPVSWVAFDRFWFEDGLVKGRVSRFDPTVLFAAVATRPRAWRRWWRSGLGIPTRPLAGSLDPRRPTA